ncbi:MAG: hypothetical protein LBH80_00385 [Prevotellaceae bacterium]|jgi:hypothetical protein|nr:hypothetical protein [Prevotellaceae bacterium]
MKTENHISIDEINRELPFSVPPDYFEQFAQKIDEQIGNRRPPLGKMMTSWLYLAAMFIGVLLLGSLFYSIYQKRFAEKNEMMEMYILSQVKEISMFDYYLTDDESQD